MDANNDVYTAEFGDGDDKPLMRLVNDHKLTSSKTATVLQTLSVCAAGTNGDDAVQVLHHYKPVRRRALCERGRVCCNCTG